MNTQHLHRILFSYLYFCVCVCMYYIDGGILTHSGQLNNWTIIIELDTPKASLTKSITICIERWTVWLNDPITCLPSSYHYSNKSIDRSLNFEYPLHNRIYFFELIKFNCWKMRLTNNLIKDRLIFLNAFLKWKMKTKHKNIIQGDLTLVDTSPGTQTSWSASKVESNEILVSADVESPS